MIASIANIPSDPATLAQWSLSHATHHRDIARRILELENIAVTEYTIDPFNMENLANWLQLHQIMHNNQNAVLGIAGNNLSQVEWTDEGQLANWIGLHFREHLAASEILGV